MKFYLTILLTCFFTAYSLNLLGQNIGIDVKKQPLNKVLLDLSSRSGISISFDNDLVSKYSVTVHKDFATFDEALSYLLRKIPLRYERTNQVYLIFPAPEKKTDPVDPLFFSGTIYDLSTYEPLPYSLLCINNKYLYSDERGSFSYREEFSDSCKVAISYLGYGTVDTIIPSRSGIVKQEFFLEPNSTKINEITVKKNTIAEQPIVGRETGKIKMNAQVAHYIPGIGDNSLFRFLTLMPGISQVSGNNSGISIWGGSSDNITIEFDGIRLFNTNHFYGNIGMINPLSIKDIEIYKGVPSSDLISSESGMIKITGKKGNQIKPSLTGEINNLTLNAIFETPAGANNTLVLAIRGMYRNPENTMFFKQKNNTTVYIPDYHTTVPISTDKFKTDYLFGDAQLKFSGSINEKSSYYLNLYQSYDKTLYQPDTTLQDVPSANSLDQRWGNKGSSIYFNQLWHKNFSSEIMVGISSNFKISNNDLILKKSQEQTISRIGNQTNSQLWDYSIKNVNSYKTKSNHQLKVGIGNDYYLIEQQFSKNDTLEYNTKNNNTLPYLFAQDKFNIGTFLVSDVGLRTTYSYWSGRMFVSPNLSATALINPSLSAAINMGRTYQFISQIPIVYADYTNKSFFTLADDKQIPVASSNQLSTSISFNRPKYQITAEAYLKRNQHISEYVPENIDKNSVSPDMGLTGRIGSGYYTGNGYARGFSVYNQLSLRKFSSWISYSLNESMRKIPQIYGDRYINSLNSYKHEIKLASVYQCNKFTFSASYIYCSGKSQHGFEDIVPPEKKNLPSAKPYNRFDLGMNFRTTIKKTELETGFSLLNVFDYENLNSFNLKSDMPGAQSNDTNNLFFEINTLPRSFCMYLKIKL